MYRLLPSLPFLPPPTALSPSLSTSPDRPHRPPIPLVVLSRLVLYCVSAIWRVTVTSITIEYTTVLKLYK